MLLPPLLPVSDIWQMRVIKYLPHMLPAYPQWVWTAQALGCDLWGHGPNPSEAMRDALSRRDGRRAGPGKS